MMGENSGRQGKVQIQIAKGIFTNRRTDGNRRKPVLELLAKHNTAVYQISKFKYDPSFVPDSMDSRKISTACSLCLPDANVQLDEEVLAYGIQNCFNLDTENSNRSRLSRSFPLLTYFWEKGKLSADQRSYGRPREIMEDPELLMSVMRQESPESQDEINKWSKLIEQVALDICSTRSWAAVLFVRFSGWLLGKLLSRIFESVCVHRGEIELLLRANSTNLPIIYIPLNRSFMDPLIIHWTLMHAGLPTPYFFTSSKFRYLTKYFGGVGSSKTRDDKEQSRICSRVLNSYIRLLLMKSASFQLPLEAKRSRSGKPSTELYGTELLKIVYDAFNSREIEDVFIVPVSVSYEILPDDFDEMISEEKSNKKRSSVVSFVKNIWRCMWKSLGGVRVDFGQPFSFREFYPSMLKNKKVNTILELYDGAFESYAKTFEAHELRWNVEHGSNASISSLYGDTSYNTKESTEGPFDQIFLDTLATHSVYSAMNLSTYMCTHLVSFLLLKKFRHGTTIEILVKEVSELKELLEKRGRDAGFTGDVMSAVAKAIELLGPDTISIVNEKPLDSAVNTFVVKPILTLESLQRLGYYSNSILPTVAMEAVIAVAVYALVGNQLAVARGFDRDVRIKDDEIMSNSRRVYEVFSGAFYLHSPCLTADVAIRRTLDIMNDASLIQLLMDEALKRSRRYYDSEEELSEDEGAKQASNIAGGEFFFIPYEYKIVSSEEICQKLSFLRGLLVPYLEMYAVISKELECVLTKDGKIVEIQEQVLRRHILTTLKTNFNESDYGELLSDDIIKTALFTFEEHGIIYCSVDANTKVRKIGITPKYDSVEQIQEVTDNILRYVTF